MGPDRTSVGKNGDIANEFGDIIISETHVITMGIVYVTARQAHKAKAFGWRVISTEHPSGYIEIKRQVRYVPKQPRFFHYRDKGE